MNNGENGRKPGNQNSSSTQKSRIYTVGKRVTRFHRWLKIDPDRLRLPPSKENEGS